MSRGCRDEGDVNNSPVIEDEVRKEREARAGMNEAPDLSHARRCGVPETRHSPLERDEAKRRAAFSQTHVARGAPERAEKRRDCHKLDRPAHAGQGQRWLSHGKN